MQSLIRASLIQVCLLGGASLGSLALLPAPEAKAACIGGDTVCTTFDPITPSNPTNIGGFSGSLTLGGTQQLNRFRVVFTIDGYTGPGFNLSNILVQGDGITGSKSVPSVAITTNDTFVSPYVNLNTSLTAGQTLDYVRSRISFTIPAGLNPGTSITAGLFYASTAETGGIPRNSLSSSSDFGTTGVVVPGPLPLLGAGVAFGFSRRLRRRIARSS